MYILLRNHRPKSIFSVLLIMLSGFLICGTSYGQDKPNLLFIIADDCTYRDLELYGGQAHTPNINRLASEGMEFSHCFQTAPMCSPTRHSIYTGLYPVKSGAYTNHSFVYDDVDSVVQYLKPLGYRVALSGKGHIGPRKVFDFEYSKNDDRTNRNDESLVDMQAVDRLMTESKQADQPFCLFACSNEPHGPWNKGKRFRKLYDAETLKLRPYMVDTPELRKAYVNYLAEISFFDSEVGRLLEMLDNHQLADNTVVVVVSEQGNDLPFAKWTCYDSGLQSAMVWRWPGRIEAGSQCDALVEYVDVLPTFIKLAGGTPNDVIDGRSLLPLLRGEASEHKEYVFGLQTSRGIYQGPQYYPIRSIRDKEYKLILNLAPEARFTNYAMNRDSFKSWEEKAKAGDEHAARLVKRHSVRPAVELYHVTEDPYELNNLADDPAYTKRIQTMKIKLKQWMDSQGDQGLATEQEAFERMTAGNDEFKQWLKESGSENRKKRHPFY